MTGAARLLPLLCLAAAACLIVSEYSTMFEFRVDGRVFDTQEGGDRHGHALVIVAVFALGALGVHLLTGARTGAAAVAAAGAIALAIFLIIDLPDANQVGELDQPVLITSKAEPAEGFWLALAGAAVLTLAGGALTAGGSPAERRPAERTGRTAPGSGPRPFDAEGELPVGEAGRGRPR